ncbi:type VI secretion system protein TssA [Novosphingobium aquimarinum]|uniref:type VI secretion system protein TssA n=1 Tax=Novosphingobium aquimarinum TaxID=2682494 RepID=UPI0012EC148F|nr:type VI secretion system ImpA family N-terminal domain-containing protein [Novosphingobium aquimarinum]
MGDLTLDIAALTAPLSDENPAGEDLSYSTERAIIEQAFEANSDDGEGPAVPWRDVKQTILAQAAETRDIWLPVYLMRAGTRLPDLDVIVQGARLLHGLLDTMWDSVHPTLDEYGFQGRKGPCDSLVGFREFLLPFKRMPLVEHERLGSFSSEQIEGFLEGDEGDGSSVQFRAAVEQLGPAYFESIAERLDTLQSTIELIDAILVDHADSATTGTVFDNLYLQIANTRKALSHFAGIEQDISAPGDEPQSESRAGPAETGVADTRQGVAGKIHNRDDVVKALDLLIEYYRNNEPSSPIPESLKRVRGWVHLDFLSLIEDIAPRSLEDARSVLTSQPPED